MGLIVHGITFIIACTLMPPIAANGKPVTPVWQAGLAIIMGVAGGVLTLYLLLKKYQPSLLKRGK